MALNFFNIMLKINIQNINIQNNFFFSYKKVFLFFYFFKKIITISYYNIYLNFLKFSFFKSKNNINNLNTDSTNTDHVFKTKNKLSTEFIKLYSLLIYTKNNWNKEVFFFNDEKINKNISFFFEKYKLQELSGNFNLKKNYQYGFYNYFFFNFFIFFNSKNTDNKKIKTNVIKKILYFNTKNITNKLFSVFMFSYFNTNFNNLNNINFISFLNNFFSRNKFLEDNDRLGSFKQEKTIYFYNFLKKIKKKKIKKKKIIYNFKGYKKTEFTNFRYNYDHFELNNNNLIKIITKNNIVDFVSETNSIFSNIMVNYSDDLFIDFYFIRDYVIDYYELMRFNDVKNKKLFKKIAKKALFLRKKKKNFFKYSYDDFLIFKKLKTNCHLPNNFELSSHVFFDLILLSKMENIYEFYQYSILDFLYTNSYQSLITKPLLDETNLDINYSIFKKNKIESIKIIDNSFFFNFIYKYLFVRPYRRKKFYIQKKINYTKTRLRGIMMDKFPTKTYNERKLKLFTLFKDNYISDYQIKKEIKKHNAFRSFIHRVKNNISLFFIKKIKKYKKRSIFSSNRYFNLTIKKKITFNFNSLLYKKKFYSGIKKKKNLINLNKNLKFFKNKYIDLVYNFKKQFNFSYFNLTDFDKNKIISKYRYWYSFFNSWNWAFLFINNFYNFESKLDYHELRAKLMYQQNKDYHNNYFYINNSKTFKDYRFMKEKDRDYFDSKSYYQKLTQKSIFYRKITSNVYYKEKLYKYRPKPYKRIKALLVKNHHSKTLRRERLRVNYFFKLNYRFQHRLTNWLYYYKLNYGLNLYYNFNLTLINTLSNSKFIPDSVYIIFLLKKQLIFLNGYCVISPKTVLYRGDCISLKINWNMYVYLIYIKKIYKYNNIIIKNFLKNKFNKYKFDNPKNWNFVFQSSIDYDVPYYTEIDYMTLSCIMLFEPDYNYIIKRNFYNLTYVPLLSLFNLNWKYVV